MNFSAIVLLLVGLAIAAYAAMRTDIDERGKRALLGICGLLIFAIGVILL